MAGSFSEILGQETNGNYTIKGSLTNEVSISWAIYCTLPLDQP